MPDIGIRHCGRFYFIVVVVFNLQPPGLPLLPTPTTIPSGRPQYRPENKHTNNQVSGLSFSFHVYFLMGYQLSSGLGWVVRKPINANPGLKVD